jgi:hypothetical protein
MYRFLDILIFKMENINNFLMAAFPNGILNLPSFYMTQQLEERVGAHFTVIYMDVLT